MMILYEALENIFFNELKKKNIFILFCLSVHEKRVSKWKVTSGFVESYFWFCGKNLNCYKEGLFITVISLWESYFYQKGLLSEYLTISWFLDKNLDFLTYSWLFLDFLEYFTIYPLLIFKESVGQAKWQRNLGFCTYFLFIITNWLQLRFSENLANQAAMDHI